MGERKSKKKNEKAPLVLRRNKKGARRTWGEILTVYCTCTLRTQVCVTGGVPKEQTFTISTNRKNKTAIE